VARIKFKGNRAAASKAAKAEGESYKVYDGPQPPRAPYRMRLIRMNTKYNTNGDPWFSVFAAIDEPVKKNGKTNVKAQYNGATARGSSNQSADYPEMFNAFLSSMGCSKTDILAVWNTGVETVDNPKGDDFVKTLGKVKIAGAALHFYGLVDMEAGGINKATKKKYPDRLGVVRFLTPNDIMGASDSPDDEDEDEESEDDELDSDEVDEDEDAEDSDEEEEGDIDEEAYEERQSELEGMTRAALKALLKPLGSEMRVTTKVKDEEIVEEILGLEFPEDEEVDSDEEEEEPEEDDLAELDRTGLKAIIKAEELDVRVVKSMTDEQIREAITMARGEAAEEVEEEPDEVEPPKDKPIVKRRSKSTAGEPPF